MWKNLLAGLGFQDRAELRRTAIQFFKFGLVGLSNTAVSMGVYYLVLWCNPALYLLGSVLGAVVSIANAFFWNDRFVFTGNARDIFSLLRRLRKTYVSYGGTSALSVALLWAEVTLFHFSKEIAPVVNLIVTIPLNFLINKFWTFRNGNLKKPGSEQNALPDKNSKTSNSMKGGGKLL